MQPSLRALRAFAEIARLGSLAAASQALNITPSAVSHLLRDLRRTMRTELIVTRGPQIHLTEAGERLGRKLITGFDAIDAAVHDLRHQAGDVRVSALSSFLTLWLMPRLGGFQARHPDIQLLLSTNLRPVDLTAEPFECAIRWGRGGWPGLAAELLFRDRQVVVTNPRLLRDAGTPAALPRLAARGRTQDWPLIEAALGWPHRAPALTVETRALAVQAAMAGLGAAVVDRNLVALLLAGGLLDEISPDPPLHAAEGHWFVALPDRLRLRPVRQFRQWLIQEAARDASPPTPVAVPGGAC